ncbi:MAG: DUF2752 domain-containing protein [Myxococcales bacterium]|nr:DUF2752 domain-containing protein [Myxococcales bacterium]
MHSGGESVQSREGRERWLNGILVAVIALPGIWAAGALTASFVWTPEGIAAGEHLDALGLHLNACSGCGLCGMSRAFSALSHGDFGAAFEYNPGVFGAWPLFWVLAFVSAWGAIHLLRRPLRFYPKGITT